MFLRLLLLHNLAESGHRRLGAVVDDVLDLELVLVVGVMLGQVTELLGQVETVVGEHQVGVVGLHGHN